MLLSLRFIPLLKPVIGKETSVYAGVVVSQTQSLIHAKHMCYQRSPTDIPNVIPTLTHSQVPTSNPSFPVYSVSCTLGDTELVSLQMCYSSIHFYFTRMISSMKKWPCHSMILTEFYSLHLWTEASLINKTYKASLEWLSLFQPHCSLTHSIILSIDS